MKDFEEKTGGLSRALAKGGTDLSSNGLIKFKNAYDEATATTILSHKLNSIKDSDFNNSGDATSSVVIVGEFPTNDDTTQLGPFLARCIEVTKSVNLERQGKTTAFTDLLKGQKYKDLKAKKLHSDSKFTHNIYKPGFGTVYLIHLSLLPES